MVGIDLIQILISATGLPQDSVRAELEKIVLCSGKKIEDLTIEEVRSLLADYLQDVLLQAKGELRALNSNGDLGT